MAQLEHSKQPSTVELLQEINAYVKTIRHSLSEVNTKIHDNPEIAWEEHFAHDTICEFLEGLGFDVVRQAYGIATAFEARTGISGPIINFNAEYDALPGIGHACGHNLITTGSLTGFLAVAHVLKKYHLPGRAVCLGTPAEEAGGGKIALLKAGAYRDILASLMAHPYSEHDITDAPGCIGTAGMTSLAVGDIHATFHGKSSHAAAYPWDGRNALDAIVSSYCNISMLRQQMHPDERVHGCIDEAPKFSNAIPHLTRLSYSYRSPSLDRLEVLEKKVQACLEAGALGTGCTVDLSREPVYADLRINDALCSSFQDNMAQLGHKISQKWTDSGSGSTDQGNVSQLVPALHAVVGIPTLEGSHPHHQSFTAAAGSKEAFERFLDTGKAMALTAMNLLTNPRLRQHVDHDFNKHAQQQRGA